MIARFKPQGRRPNLAAALLVGLGLVTGTDARSAARSSDPDATASDPGAPPRIVQTSPAVGATEVDPATAQITVQFDRDMAEGFSWTGGGPQFPEGRAGQKPHWTDEGRTCILPVQLQANQEYRPGLNSPSHRSFQSAGGVPLEPVAYTFKTK
jgi:hypothetical protein